MSEPATPASPAGSLNYTRTDSVALPQSTAEKRLAIRMLDWERLKRHVAKCRANQESDLAGWYFFCFGFSGSAFLTIIPLELSEKVPSWAVPSYLAAAIGSLVLGIALVVVHRRSKKERADRIEELNIDMGEIEAGFGQM